MWLAASTAVLILLALRSEYEKKHFSVERTRIVSDKLLRDCTLVFLSDLHNNEFGAGNEKLIAAIDQVNPDLVLVGGDMMICNGEPGVGVPLRLICNLASRYPVICGNGNHETRMNRERRIYGDQYDRYVKTLKDAGVTYLDNDSTVFREDIAVTGADLEKRFYAKFFPAAMESSYLENRAGGSDSGRFQILLCHSPLYFKGYRRWGADLSLAGHFHGGTIRIPGLGGVMTPQYQFFLPQCAGTFEEEGRYMIVSRGLGTHSVNLRLNDKPQLVVVELKAGGKP